LLQQLLLPLLLLLMLLLGPSPAGGPWCCVTKRQLSTLCLRGGRCYVLIGLLSKKGHGGTVSAAHTELGVQQIQSTAEVLQTNCKGTAWGPDLNKLEGRLQRSKNRSEFRTKRSVCGVCIKHEGSFFKLLKIELWQLLKGSSS
jgi:hypothetical protein